jgi:site-specific recombinase XerD
MDFLYLKELNPYSIKIYMTYIGGFFKFMYKNDLVTEDPTRKVPGVKVPKKDVVYIPHDEILKELDQMLKNPKRKGCSYKVALRDYFIIRVGYVTGWRASESLACNPDEDINWETGEVYIPRRKGGKDGTVYMDMETTQMLNQWYHSNYPNGKRLWYTRMGKPMV